MKENKIKRRGNIYPTGGTSGDMIKDIIHFTEWLKIEPDPEHNISDSQLKELCKHSEELLRRTENYVYTSNLDDPREFNRLKKEVAYLIRLSREKIGYSLNQQYRFFGLEDSLENERIDDWLNEKKKKYPEQLKEYNRFISEFESSKKKDEDKLWFKTGIRIADGTAEKLHKEGMSWSKVSLELGFKSSCHNYFSESIGNTLGSSKNLYENEKKYRAVYSYLKENGLEMCPKFKEMGKKFHL